VFGTGWHIIAADLGTTGYDWSVAERMPATFPHRWVFEVPERDVDEVEARRAERERAGL
jgi:hypothetical protein